MKRKFKVMYVIVALLMAIAVGCSPHTIVNYNEEFVKKYGMNDFNIFKNKSFLIRDLSNGNPVVYIWPSADLDENCGFVSMVVSRETNALLSAYFVPQHSECQFSFDTIAYHQLAIAFLNYNINDLTVDVDNNVEVKVVFYEGPCELVRFNNIDTIPDTVLYQRIKDSWWQLKRNVQNGERN